MELIDAIQKVIENYVDASSPADLVIGTVSKTAPLEVTLEDTRLMIPSQALRLTESVVEKKIQILSHQHSCRDGTTGKSLSDIQCTENGKTLPIKDGYILLNRGLETGDRVLMLQVMAGQNFVILSRVF